MVQLAMRIKEPKRIPEIIERLSEIILGFHLTTNDTTFFYKKKEVRPIMIPNFDDLEQSARFMYENHSPDFSETLATVGTNFDTIVLNCGHLCADGVYLINVADEISNIDNRKVESFPKLPANIAENFDKQIHSKNVEQCPYIFTDPDLIRVQVKQNIKPENVSKYAKHVRISIPIPELKIYDKETKKVNGLTEFLWSTFILSTAAYNNKIDKTGIATCIDMRKYLNKDQVNWNVCNHYSNISPATFIDEKMSVKELGRNMRLDFNDKINKGHHYSFLNSLIPPDGKPIPGIGLELSNIGRFKIGGPIEDIFVKSCVMDKSCDPLISHSSFSVSSPSSNILNGMFRYPSSKVDDKTATIIAKSVEYALKYLPLDTTVGSALDFIQKYQKTIKY